MTSIQYPVSVRIEHHNILKLDINFKILAYIDGLFMALTHAPRTVFNPLGEKGGLCRHTNRA